MQDGIRTFLEGIGERFEEDDLERTPERVAKAWLDDLVSGYASDAGKEITWTTAKPGGGLVVLRDVRFTSICVHHLLPFTGRAHLAYLPDTRLAGLSKLGRVVDCLSRRLQIQERLTGQIADTIDHSLQPRGTVVALEAEHTCMTLRGVRKEESRLTTLASRGAFRDDPVALHQVLSVLLPGTLSGR